MRASVCVYVCTSALIMGDNVLTHVRIHCQGAVKGEECPFTEATKMVSAHEMNGKGAGTEVVDGA